MKKVAFDYAEEARRWRQVAGDLVVLIHMPHPIASDNLSFETCPYRNCIEARKLLGAAELKK